MSYNRILCRPYVFALFAVSAVAQDDPGVTAFARLKSAVNQAANSSQSAPENIRADLNRYLTDTSDMAGRLWDRYQGSLRREQPPKVSQVYLASLDADSSTLETLHKVATDSRVGVVREVRDDLRTKVDFASRSLGIGGAFPSVVRVTVETERNGTKVNSLWVRCNPRRYGVTKNPMFVFNSATSPTSAQLPPGVFIMWVEATSGGQVLMQQPVDIGVNGLDHDTIRLALP